MVDVVARLAAHTALLVVLGAVLWIAGGPILTDDLWWHLKMGEAYAAGGPWLASDPLLHTAFRGGPVQHEWLFGVLVHSIDRLGGFAALRVAHFLTVVGIAALAYATARRELRSSTLSALAVTVFLVLGWWRLMQARPDLASIAATLLFYRLLLAGETPPSKPAVALAVLLLALWANLHSLFAIAFPLGAAACVGLAARQLVMRIRRVADRGASATAAFPEDWLRLRRIGLGLGIGAVASLLNPRGIQQHLTFFRSSANAGIWHIGDEWRHFDPFHFDPQHESLGYLEWLVTDVVALLFLGTALYAIVRVLRNPTAERLRTFDPVLYALGFAALVAMWTSIRFLWLGILPVLALLRSVALWSEGAPATPARAGGALRYAIPSAALVAVTLALAFPNGTAHWVVRGTLPGSLGEYLRTPYLAHKYGVPGVQFMRDAGLEGRLFNHYGQGGFLAYWLAPRLSTFIDGRTEHYPPSVLRDHARVVGRDARNARGIGTILDDRGVDLFVGFGFPNAVPRGAMRFSGEHLRGNPDWLLVSRSVMHALWLRRNAANRTNLERVQRYYANEGIPFDPERGFDAARILSEHTRWAIAAGLVPQEFATLLTSHQTGGSRDDQRRLAIVLALMGAYEEQLRFDRRSLAQHGATPDLLRRIAYGALRVGRIAEAQRASASLLEIAADDPRTQHTASIVRRYAAWSLAERGGAGTAEPVELLDRFPLLDAADQAWILDSQRGLRVRAQAEKRSGSKRSTPP